MENLYDYAVRAVDGFTIEDAAKALDADLDQVRVAIYDLRRLFLADDEINLICRPEHGRARWTYRLVGTREASEFWTTNRTKDAKTRLITIGSVCRSIVNATDGRTRQGREARIILRHVERAEEDLADLQASV